jgi:glycerophosphoryl diester phosphodiesterase
LGSIFSVKLAAKIFMSVKVEQLQKGKRIGEAPKPFWEYNLIAHAGGALFDDNGKMLTYTNSKEAIELNYEKGHRVFEIDFSLTQDMALAALHDWEHGANITGGRGGILTLDEWHKQKIYGKYTTMDIDDVIMIMNDYKDMYLVTDSKNTDMESILIEFKAIYNAAKSVDIEILNRIIPQIYHPEMLGIVQSVYDFPQYIYTLYQSPQSDSEVIEFVTLHEEIKVLTMWPDRASDAFVADLSAIDKLVYCHTINKIDEAVQLFSKNVYGLYTDYLY